MVRRIDVRAVVNLPELERGRTGLLPDDARTRGLLASGRLALARPEIVLLPPETGETVTPPVGTIAQIMAWVGDDPDRAVAALDRELASTTARSTLINQLLAICSG